jgi:hypothetical protein
MMMGMGRFNQVIRKGKTVDAGLALIGAGLAIAALRQIASVGGRALVAIPSAPLGSRQAR